MTLLTYQLHDHLYPYTGILNFIKLYTGNEDIHTSGDIKITVLNNNSNIRDIRTPIGYKNEDHNEFWASKSIDESWYEIDFKKYSVLLNSFVIQANEEDFQEWWEILGSNDGFSYESICKQERNKVEKGNVKHLECTKNQKYQKLRLRGHGNRTLDSKLILGLYGIEFYGYLYLDKNSILTIKLHCKNNHIYSLLFVSLIKC